MQTIINALPERPAKRAHTLDKQTCVLLIPAAHRYVRDLSPLSVSVAIDKADARSFTEQAASTAASELWQRFGIRALVTPLLRAVRVSA